MYLPDEEGSVDKSAKEDIIDWERSQAARTGGVFHLWFHPFNLGHAPSKDLQRLERVLGAAKNMVESGDIECRPMREVAALARQGRWG